MSPKPSARQVKIINGLLLGDGWITSSDESKPYLRTRSVREDYIEWLKEELGELASYRSSSVPGDSDIGTQKKYALTTLERPWFKGYRNRWYNDGEKELPSSLTLNPLTLKLWYVGDGTLDWTKTGRRRVQIGAINFSDSAQRIRYIFKKKGMTAKFTPSGIIYLTCDSTERFFEYIGESVPGFEYKFAEDRDEYDEIKPRHLKE